MDYMLKLSEGDFVWHTRRSCRPDYGVKAHAVVSTMAAATKAAHSRSHNNSARSVGAALR